MNESQSVHLFPTLSSQLKECAAEFDQIPEARKADLLRLAEYVRHSLDQTQAAKLTFICTHNSRRSHLSQIWAKVAADANGLGSVLTFSGGTEATAMNPRVVTSLKASGFDVDAENPDSENPVYQIRYADDAEALRCFSKVYDQPPNPTTGYAAVMTCSSADDACPVVPGCDLRSPIRYEDPKAADDTPAEADTYNERSRQICREMTYLFHQVEAKAE